MVIMKFNLQLMEYHVWEKMTSDELLENENQFLQRIENLIEISRKKLSNSKLDLPDL